MEEEKMKKIGKMVLMMMLAIPLLGTNVTAATTENPDGRAVMNPCDDILQPGEYAQFSPRNSGMTSYRVDKVDAAKDLIYNNKLKAWLNTTCWRVFSSRWQVCANS